MIPLYMMLMPKAPLHERFAATVYAASMHFREPAERQIQRLPLWPVFRQSTEDILHWVNLAPSRRAEAERYVGMVTMRREPLIELQQQNPYSRLGIARAFGRAVLFAPWPPHAIVGLLTPVEETDLQFGMYLPGPEGMRVAPAVWLRHGKMLLTSPDAVAEARVLPIAGISPHLRVY